MLWFCFGCLHLKTEPIQDLVATPPPIPGDILNSGEVAITKRPLGECGGWGEPSLVPDLLPCSLSPAVALNSPCQPGSRVGPGDTEQSVRLQPRILWLSTLSVPGNQPAGSQVPLSLSLGTEEHSDPLHAPRRNRDPPVTRRAVSPFSQPLYTSL